MMQMCFRDSSTVVGFWLSPVGLVVVVGWEGTNTSAARDFGRFALKMFSDGYL